jgi:hypothetical protein
MGGIAVTVSKLGWQPLFPPLVRELEDRTRERRCVLIGNSPLLNPFHEPGRGRARHSVRAVGNDPNAPVGSRGAPRTDAPKLGDRFMVPMHVPRLMEAFHEPQGGACHSVRAIWNKPDAPVGNRGAQRTDAPYLCRFKGARRVRMSGRSLPAPASRGDEEDMPGFETDSAAPPYQVEHVTTSDVGA